MFNTLFNKDSLSTKVIVSGFNDTSNQTFHVKWNKCDRTLLFLRSRSYPSGIEYLLSQGLSTQQINQLMSQGLSTYDINQLFNRGIGINDIQHLFAQGLTSDQMKEIIAKGLTVVDIKNILLEGQAKVISQLMATAVPPCAGQISSGESVQNIPIQMPSTDFALQQQESSVGGAQELCKITVRTSDGNAKEFVLNQEHGNQLSNLCQQVDLSAGTANSGSLSHAQPGFEHFPAHTLRHVDPAQLRKHHTSQHSDTSSSLASDVTSFRSGASGGGQSNLSASGSTR